MSPWSRICPMKPTVKPVSRLAAGVLVLASLALTGCYTAGGSGVSGQSSLAPTVLASPQSQTVALGAGASFTVTGSGTPLPSYQWQRSNDGGMPWTARPPRTTRPSSGRCSRIRPAAPPAPRPP